MEIEVRAISDKISNKMLQKDLQHYRTLALNLGATDARIIKTNQIIIDERVIMKCINPRCAKYGSHANCPPYTISPETMIKILSKYRYAIFFYLQVPSEDFTGPTVLKYNRAKKYQRKTSEIVSKIEALAFYNGYYLAQGFSTGPCQSYLCDNRECPAIKVGGACRFPLKSRPAMEGVGMDVFKMATQMGWKVYPCGAGIDPQSVPHGADHGLILIH